MPELLSPGLESLLGYAARGVIDRGRAYFREGAVVWLEDCDPYVDARVMGSEEYEVWVGLTEEIFEESYCTCPYFEDRDEPCKHIVAALYAADERGFYPDRFLRDEQPSALREQVTSRNADRSTPSSVAPPWQMHLARVLSGRQAEQVKPTLPAGSEVLYVIDLGDTTHGRDLTLEVACREPKLNGQWSVLKRRTLTQRDIPTLPTPIDRRALSILLGSKDDNHSYDHYDYNAQPGYRFHPHPALHRDLFALIGPTGRCHLRRSSDKDDLTPLRWNDRGDWRMRLEVEPVIAGGDYRMATTLYRGDEVRLIHEPEVLTLGGLMVMDDALSLLAVERPGLQSWIDAERDAHRFARNRGGGTGKLAVPRQQAGALITELLNMPDVPVLHLPDELQYETVRGEPAPRLWISAPDPDARDKHFKAELRVGYGPSILNEPDNRRGVFDPEARQFIERDPSAEAALTRVLLDLTFKQPAPYKREHDWHFLLHSKHLSTAAAQLVDAGWHVEAQGKLYRSGAAMNLTLQSGIDWFELHGEATFGEQTASLPALLQALRSGSGSVVLDDGTLGLLPEDWLKRYGLLGDLGEVSGEHLRFRVPQAMLLDALLSELPSVDVDAHFERIRRRIKRFGQGKPKQAPRTFKGELRPYQREGLGWLHQLGRLGLGGCLADDMGLGKTIQVLAMLEARRTAVKSERSESPSLVVVPKSLIFNWKQEAARFTPHLKVLDHTGKDRMLAHGLTKTDLQKPDAAQRLDTVFRAHDVILTTYGTLRRDATILKDIAFDYAILDEAQAIKNANTASAKAARLIQADHRLAMSGTPIENHLGELWSLFAFINPGMLGQGRLGKQLQSSSQSLDTDSRLVLAKALRPFILRRTKDQVATDLPDKSEQTLYCEMSPKQRKNYNALRDHYRASLLGHVQTHGLAKSKIQVLEALLRLRQAACHPGLIHDQHINADSAKLDQLIPQLESIISEGHKALVFSQFTKFLGLVRKRIDPLGIDYQYLDGKTRKRQVKVERFQEDPDCKLFLISLKAGGTGLNLTAADYVFLMDPWWNPAVEAQAIDRTHRIGQDKQVFAYRLITKNTVEEKVIELQQTKRELADAILGKDNSILRDLTREDLEALLS